MLLITTAVCAAKVTTRASLGRLMASSVVPLSRCLWAMDLSPTDLSRI
jgi:hypothetical protein